MTKLDHRNKRCRKLVNKKYRRYGDIWGRLALKKRDNFITNLVYGLESRSFGYRRRRLPYKIKWKVKKMFRTKIKRKPSFAFEINITTKPPRKRRLSRRGNLLKLRRQISLYYGGGRIRQKTFRRYGRMASERSKETIEKEGIYSYHPYDSYGAIVESRLDVLLLRSNFVNSIYQARAYVQNHKVYIQGQKYTPHPATLIKNFQQFGLRGNYTLALKKSLLTRIKKHAVLCLPSYLCINFSLLVAFKIEDPITNAISYPFAEQRGTAAMFRKAFAFL
jgi:ribosomal protein S4